MGHDMHDIHGLPHILEDHAVCSSLSMWMVCGTLPVGEQRSVKGLYNSLAQLSSGPPQNAFQSKVGMCPSPGSTRDGQALPE